MCLLTKAGTSNVYVVGQKEENYGLGWHDQQDCVCFLLPTPTTREPRGPRARGNNQMPKPLLRNRLSDVGVHSYEAPNLNQVKIIDSNRQYFDNTGYIKWLNYIHCSSHLGGRLLGPTV